MSTTEIWLRDLIQIGQHTYEINVLHACDDGVVIHATSIESTATKDVSRCFQKAADGSPPDDDEEGD